MSKGSKNVIVRFPEEALEAMHAQLRLSEPHRKGEPWTVSEFIRTAVAEKLAKMERSRRARGKRRVPLGDEIVSLGKGE